MIDDETRARIEAIMEVRNRHLVDDLDRMMPAPPAPIDKVTRERDDARRGVAALQDEVKAKDDRIGELERAMDRMFRAQHAQGGHRGNRGNRGNRGGGRAKEPS